MTPNILVALLGTLVCVQVISRVESAGYEMQCPATSDASALRRLKSKLFCDYDEQERPIKNRTAPLTVAIGVDILHIDVDEAALSPHNLITRMIVDWHDEFLKWEEADFDNISEIQVPIKQIWIPNLSTYNAKIASFVVQQGITNYCSLNHWGRIFCTFNLQAPLHCKHDALRWPFDERTCFFNLYSWMHPGAQLDLQLYLEGYDTTRYSPNPEWELLDVNINKHIEKFPCCPDESYPTLQYSLNLRRHAILHVTSMIVPAFVLAGVTLISFCTHHSTLRVLICLASLLGNMSFLLHLGQKLPSDGDSRPIIVVFYRDAMLLSALALGVALLVGWIDEIHSSPMWAQNMMVWVSSKGGRSAQMLLSPTYSGYNKNTNTLENGDATHTITNSEPSPDSRSLALLIDRLSLLTFIVTYGVILTALTP